jgi:tRNA (adenine37-N6)-methyltransferase
METFTAERFAMQAIGTIRTNFTMKYDTPRQPPRQPSQSENDAEASLGAAIYLFPHCNYEQALADVEGFERIWLLYIFHKNVQPLAALDAKPSWRPKVLPPRGRTKRGVFSTRAPYRPNAIGMSVVTLKRVQGLVLHVGNCDVLDGTPIIDIKPYIPLYDSFPESRTGWLGDEIASAHSYTVAMTDLGKRQLAFLNQRQPAVWQYWHNLLRSDPHPHPYRRIRQRKPTSSTSSRWLYECLYECSYKDWRLLYRLDESANCVVVESVESRYDAATIALWGRLLDDTVNDLPSVIPSGLANGIPTNAHDHYAFFQAFA